MSEKQEKLAPDFCEKRREDLLQTSRDTTQGNRK